MLPPCFPMPSMHPLPYLPSPPPPVTSLFPSTLSLSLPALSPRPPTPHSLRRFKLKQEVDLEYYLKSWSPDLPCQFVLAQPPGRSGWRSIVSWKILKEAQMLCGCWVHIRCWCHHQEDIYIWAGKHRFWGHWCGCWALFPTRAVPIRVLQYNPVRSDE